MSSLDSKIPFWHDIDAFAGAGKSHALKALIHSVRAQGKICLVASFQGNVASLYDGASTIHRLFQIKFDDHLSGASFMPDRTSTTVEKRTKRAELFKVAIVLFLDENTDITEELLDLIDRTLKAVRDSNEPFGGLSLVTAGDWRQLLPIPHLDISDPLNEHNIRPITSSLKYETLKIILKHHALWKGITKTFHLTKNYRITDVEYAAFVLQVAKDTCPHINISYNNVKTLRPVVLLPNFTTFLDVTKYDILSFAFPTNIQYHVFDILSFAFPINSQYHILKFTRLLLSTGLLLTFFQTQITMSSLTKQQSSAPPTKQLIGSMTLSCNG